MASAIRKSELASIYTCDLAITESGLVVDLTHSEIDRGDAGREVAALFSEDAESCPPPGCHTHAGIVEDVVLAESTGTANLLTPFHWVADIR
jgi:hypothetical protein